MADCRGYGDYSHHDYAAESSRMRARGRAEGLADKVAGRKPNDYLYRVASPEYSHAKGYREGYDARHGDDLAVDDFCVVMKEKMAKSRAKGRGGWDDPLECSISYLSELLRDHVEKGDPVDVANLATMIHQRGASITKMEAA